MIKWKMCVVIGLGVCFIMALICVYLTVALRNDIRRGRLPLEEIRLYKGGSMYRIDKIESLGMDKHFLSFKEE